MVVVVPVITSSSSKSDSTSTDVDVMAGDEDVEEPPPVVQEVQQEETPEAPIGVDERADSLRPDPPTISGRRTENLFEYNPDPLVRALLSGVQPDATPLILSSPPLTLGARDEAGTYVHTLVRLRTTFRGTLFGALCILPY